MEPELSLQIHLLLFTVGKVHFALVASQIQALEAYRGSGGESPFWFHEEMGYPETPIYHSPMLAIVPMGDGPPARVVITEMEELLDVPVKAIRPFPPLIEPFALRKGMFGLLVHRGKHIILVDLQRLFEKEALMSQRSINVVCMSGGLWSGSSA